MSRWLLYEVGKTHRLVGAAGIVRGGTDKLSGNAQYFKKCEDLRTRRGRARQLLRQACRDERKGNCTYSGSYKVGSSTHATFFLKLLQNQAQTTAF